MGSPYMSFEVNRVNVIRSRAGAVKLLIELSSIAGRPLNHNDAVELLDTFEFDYLLLPSLEEVQWNARKMLQKTSFHTFDGTIVDFLTTYAKARKSMSRSVLVLATRYQWSDVISDKLDRCVVMDFTDFSKR